MALTDRLERSLGWIAIPGLTRIVASGMLIIFGAEFMGILDREAFLLQGEAVWEGQIWRLASFVFVPISQHPLFFLFEAMLVVLAGDALEEEWGPFRFTLYYLTGALCTLGLAFFFPFFPLGSYFLNLSLFLAFATLFPDYEFLIFFVLPVKAKHLALLSGLGILWGVATLPWALKAAALAALGNYLLFFGPAFWRGVQGRTKRARQAARLDRLAAVAAAPRHRCATCGRTERDGPDLEFRYCTCAQCGPEGRAFCRDDLERHKQSPATTNAGIGASAGKPGRPEPS